METEIEVKFPNINIFDIKSKLKNINASKIHDERLMKRKTYDNKDHSMSQKGGWIRVRDEGDKVTISYKQLNERTLHGTKEISIVINDFEKACQIFNQIGLIEKSFQETKREKWLYKNTEITIDTWPWIPTFLEIEGPNETEIKETVEKLELNWEKAMCGSAENVYQMHYNVTEKEIDEWKEILFIDTPKWLLEKRIKPTS